MGAPCSTCRRNTSRADNAVFKEPNMRQVGLVSPEGQPAFSTAVSASPWHHFHSMQPVGTLPMNSNLTYMPPEDKDQPDLRQMLRAIFAPRLTCCIGLTFGLCFLMASCITIAALMPNETTTTTTTTTSVTSTTTTFTTVTSTSTTLTSTGTTTASMIHATNQAATATQQRAGSLRGSTVPPAPTSAQHPTTTRIHLAAVSLFMKVQQVDCTQLLGHPKLRSAFEEQVKGAIASEAGHGIQPDSVSLKLRAGSVVIEATIASLVTSTAESVVNGLQSTSALGQSVASNIRKVEGIGNVSTGPITVTDVNAKTAPDAPPLPPESQEMVTSGPSGLLIGLISGAVCLFLVACLLLLFLVRRRRQQQGDYAQAAEDDSLAREETKAFPASPEGSKPKAAPKAATKASPKTAPKAKGATAPRPAGRSPAAAAAAQAQSPTIPDQPDSEVLEVADWDNKPKAKATAKAPAKAKMAARPPPGAGEPGSAPAKAKAKAPAAKAAKAPAAKAKAPSAKAKAGPGAGRGPSASFLETAKGMGFSAEQATAAFHESGGNEDTAMDKLLRS